jgi:hypothetical protein
MLAALALVAAIGGGTRYWYDVQVAPSRADAAVLASADFRGVTVRWSQPAADWWILRRRIAHVWFDEAKDFDAPARRLDEVTAVGSVQVLGRQLIPHAAAFQRGEPDAVIEAWRRHPTLRQALVDASVRGAPLGEPVRLYTREDLAILQLALPDLEIVWMEVH